MMEGAPDCTFLAHPTPIGVPMTPTSLPRTGVWLSAMDPRLQIYNGCVPGKTAQNISKGRLQVCKSRNSGELHWICKPGVRSSSSSSLFRLPVSPHITYLGR